MILDIKKYPNSILKKKSGEIKEITSEIKELALNMVRTMIKNEGVGLAAPQIGILKRIIAVQVREKPAVFINPKIVERSKETEIGEEGCLSFPGLYLKIKRRKGVEIEALNLEGEKIKIKTQGLLARIFQHEIDHLDGVLFIEKIPFWQRLKIKRTK